ncbi:MAG: hypothetical protein K6G60_03160 [Lachnospiraceae bacterium]|nr:hypothetical protein [Lachnospiraceae bacterium]
MSKKRNNPSNENKRTEADYYKLNTDAVDRLVNANASTAPKVSDEEIRKYTGKRKIHIPSSLKILFIKFWFNGAACFFFFWGLGTYLNSIDLLFVFAVALGILTDVLENNLIRFLEKTPGEFNRYMMFPRKGLPSFFLNIVYAFVVLAMVQYVYNLINVTAMKITGDTDALFLGVEPILFGLFYLAADMLLILIKNTFIKIFKDAVAKQDHGVKK